MVSWVIELAFSVKAMKDKHKEIECPGRRAVNTNRDNLAKATEVKAAEVIGDLDVQVILSFNRHDARPRISMRSNRAPRQYQATLQNRRSGFSIGNW